MSETQPILGESWERWLHEIRRIEFVRLMELIPIAPAARVLELGSGDGYQLDLLRQRFERVFAIDAEHRPARTEGFCFSLAEHLPFPDGAFDLVASCCVVEHLGDRARALAEAVRVLKAGGTMAHIVPSSFWKAASVVLNPVGYPIRVAERWWALRNARRRHSGVVAYGPSRPATAPPGLLQVLGRWFYPPIHGTYPSHFAEYRTYAREQWLKLFRHPELSLVAEVPLLAYSHFGLLRFRLLGLRQRLARHGFASSRAYILRKIE